MAQFWRLAIGSVFASRFQAWDYDGQLTSITQGASTVSFTYDGLGRRLSRTAGGTTTQFLSSGSQVYLEAVGNTVTAQYAYGNALIRKDGEYPLFDGLGSERTVTNASQAVTGTVNFDAFGNQVGSTGSSSNPYMYAATSGYRNDGDVGLMHVGARYYDAQVGRWTSRDTVLTEHPYLYCSHNPVNRVDPSGHVAGVDDAIGLALLFLFAALVLGTVYVLWFVAHSLSRLIGPIFSHNWGDDAKDRYAPHPDPVLDEHPGGPYPPAPPPPLPGNGTGPGEGSGEHVPKPGPGSHGPPEWWPHQGGGLTFE